MTGSHMQIFTRRLDLPVPDQITHQSENCLTPFFSRNGERIYYRQGGQLWSVATVGGAPQKVLDEVGVFAIAPDGVTTAVARRDAAGSLSFGRLGSKDWKLYKKPPFDQNFSGRAVEFSPDGKKLAILFSRTNSGEGELWLVPYPPESGSPRKLFAGATGATFFGFSWMPDSRRLAVAISQGDEPSQIFLGDAESGALRKLTAGLEHRAGPAVSPDGSRIAFTQATPDNDVIEVALDGSAVTPILASARSEGSAQWSANGREFIYNSDAGGHAELWARNVETGRARPLFNRMQELMPAGRFSDFAVAPDGERLAINLSSGGEHTIWLLRQSAGKALRLDPENADHHSPSWSPDGNWIAYGRVLPKEQLMKAPAGGGVPVPVAAIDWLGGPAEVAWSPSGEWIAWAADTITLYSPDGKQQKKLAGAMNRSIGFSRDGKTLYTYYPGPDRGHWLIDAYDVASGQMHRSGAFTLDPNTSPRGFSLHPDGKRFLATLIKDNLDIVLLQGF
jgi:Tol biopolymer transport system component